MYAVFFVVVIAMNNSSFKVGAVVPVLVVIMVIFIVVMILVRFVILKDLDGFVLGLCVFKEVS